jgi:hypothetical protein
LLGPKRGDKAGARGCPIGRNVALKAVAKLDGLSRAQCRAAFERRFS